MTAQKLNQKKKKIEALAELMGDAPLGFDPFTSDKDFVETFLKFPEVMSWFCVPTTGDEALCDWVAVPAHYVKPTREDILDGILDMKDLLDAIEGIETE